MEFKNLIKSKLVGLSKSQQKIAKYILDHFDEALFATASQLADKVSVSETTVIRFSYALGFEGFSDMNKEMRRSVVGSIENANQGICEAELLNGLSCSQLDTYIQNQIANGNKAYQYINLKEFIKICDFIMTKKKVLIIGYMDSFGVASELLHVLEKMRKKVYLYRLLHREEDILYDLDEDVVVLTVSFSPHYKYTLDHTITAKEGGSTIITLTDSLITPFTNISDYSLIFNLNRNPKIDLIDMSPVVGFIFLMGNYMYSHYREDIDKYRNSIERRKEKYVE